MTLDGLQTLSYRAVIAQFAVYDGCNGSNGGKYQDVPAKRNNTVNRHHDCIRVRNKKTGNAISYGKSNVVKHIFNSHIQTKSRLPEKAVCSK